MANYNIPKFKENAIKFPDTFDSHRPNHYTYYTGMHNNNNQSLI